MKALVIDFFNKEEKASKQWMATVVFSMVILSLWTMSILFSGFSLPLYFITFSVLSLFVFVTPSAGLPIIILATMWFQRWFTLEPIIIGDIVLKLYPIDVIFLATMIGYVFHHLFGRQKLRFKLYRVDFVLIVFMILCTGYLGYAFIDGLSDNALAVSAFKNYAFYAFLYVLLRLQLSNQVELKRMIKVLFVGGWGILFFVFMGVVLGRGLWTEYNPLSTEGTRLLSFPHAYYLSTVLIISLVFLLYYLRPHRETLMVMWLQFFGVIGSLMRHLWLALFGATVFLFFALPKKAKYRLLQFLSKNAVFVFFITVILAFTFVIFPFSPVTDRIDGIVDPLVNRAVSLAESTADSSARWRFFAWRAAKESIVQFPILGTGFGRELTVEFDTYRIVVPMRELHNSLLVILVQMGIVGMLVFLYLLWLLFTMLYQSWKTRGEYFPYQLAFFSAILVFLFSSMTQPYFETNFTGVFFWILMGLFVVSYHLEEIA